MNAAYLRQSEEKARLLYVRKTISYCLGHTTPPVGDLILANSLLS